MAKLLRGIALALLGSLLVGFILGTWLRTRSEAVRPIFVGCAIGDAASALAAAPRDVGHAGTAVLDACNHEEEIGEPVQVAQRRRIQRLARV